MTDINLVPEESKKTESLDNLKDKLTIVSVAVLALTAIGAVVTLAFFGYFSNQREVNVSRVNEAAGIIDDFKSTEELLVVTKDKASTAESLVNSRVKYVDFFATVVEILPQRVSFNSMNVGKEQVTFSGKAGSSADIAGLVSALTSEKGQEIVSNVDVGSLSSDESKEYNFSVVAELKQ